MIGVRTRVRLMLSQRSSQVTRLLKARRRVPLLNKLSAEDAVRTPAVFQLMPHRDSVRFLDENLQPLQIDLYDPASWKQYGWSPIVRSGFPAALFWF